MATVTGNANATIAFTQIKSTGLVGSVAMPAVLSPAIAFATTGTGASQADLLYQATGSLVSTSVTLDLTSLTDPGGGAINMARVVGFIIQNTATTDGYILTVGNAASNQWTGFCSSTTATVSVLPGGFLASFGPTATGYVTGGSSKSWKISSGSNTVGYKIIIVGRSA